MGSVDRSEVQCASEPKQDIVWRMTAKRALDVLVSGSGLILFFPVMVLIALVVKLSSPGPIFFRWNVVGLGGRP
ncbi:MAG: sugar transferase, partial [Candidatus Saccharimonadales bacterium]